MEFNEMFPLEEPDIVAACPTHQKQTIGSYTIYVDDENNLKLQGVALVNLSECKLSPMYLFLPMHEEFEKPFNRTPFNTKAGQEVWCFGIFSDRHELERWLVEGKSLQDLTPMCYFFDTIDAAYEMQSFFLEVSRNTLYRSRGLEVPPVTKRD